MRKNHVSKPQLKGVNVSFLFFTVHKVHKNHFSLLALDKANMLWIQQWKIQYKNICMFSMKAITTLWQDGSIKWSVIVDDSHAILHTYSTILTQHLYYYNYTTLHLLWHYFKTHYFIRSCCKPVQQHLLKILLVRLFSRITLEEIFHRHLSSRHVTALKWHQNLKTPCKQPHFSFKISGCHRALDEFSNMRHNAYLEQI